MNEQYFDVTEKMKQDILKEFAETFDHGTYSDCRTVVQKAAKYGITCKELCDYKRILS